MDRRKLLDMDGHSPSMAERISLSILLRCEEHLNDTACRKNGRM
jgi:hypothetical protein